MAIWQATAGEYHADASRLSNSLLNVFRDGGGSALYDAMHYCVRREESDAIRMGTALHCLVLETERFQDEYGLDLVKDFDRRTKVGKAGHAAHVAGRDQRRTYLDRDEMALLHEQAEAIGRHRKATRAIAELPGLSEVAVTWEDDETGLPMKARMDRVLVDAGLIVDLKTTASIGLKEWEESSWKYRYHAQAALYLDAARREWGKDFGFIFVVVSSARPVQVAVRVPDEGLLDAGRLLNRETLRNVAECWRSGDWWQTETYSAPMWAKR